MRKKIIILAVLVMLLLSIYTSVVPGLQLREEISIANKAVTNPLFHSKMWSKIFGGPLSDSADSAEQTMDGGYIMTGYTEVGVEENWIAKVYLLKTDANGNTQWDTTFCRSAYDEGKSVVQTKDGGYILTGLTVSYDPKTEYHWDMWVIKTDSLGKEQWNRTLGDVYWDWGDSIQQTQDGGYIIAGTFSYSDGPDGARAWLLKLDPSGTIEWEKKFGMNGEFAIDVDQTTDGGYIITGSTYSYGAPPTKFGNVWLLKTDNLGRELWNKTYGGDGQDRGLSVQQTTDGGYIITGWKETYTYSEDIWLIKTNSEGQIEWDKIFSRIDDNPNAISTISEQGYSVQQTADGGYIVVGLSGWGYQGENMCDIWLIKTDNQGNMIWDRTFGGYEYDRGYSVQQTTDGGYIIAGTTASYSNGSYWDAWLIKTDENGFISNPPNTPTITGKTNGKIGTLYDYTIQTSDPDQDDVQYHIDWGDNTATTITGWNESGKQVVVSHIWDTKGTYNVKVKAIDVYGAESNWTTLTVTMPCSYNIPLFQFWERLLERFPNAFPQLRHLLGY